MASSANLVGSAGCSGQPFIAEKKDKKTVYIVASVAILACAIIVGAIAGPIFGFIATVVFAAVVISLSITLTETPSSAKESFEKIKKNFNTVKEFFEDLKQKFAGRVGSS